MPRFLSIGIVLLAGCQLTGARVIPSPLTYSEQEKEILAIVPLGIDRDEAVKKLAAAGVRGEFGTSRSIYYCDLWERKNGELWHMNVALLFDKSGKLYKSQMSQAEIGTATGKEAALSPKTDPAAAVQPEAARVNAPATSSDQFKVGREVTGASR